MWYNLQHHVHLMSLQKNYIYLYIHARCYVISTVFSSSFSSTESLKDVSDTDSKLKLCDYKYLMLNIPLKIG